MLTLEINTAKDVENFFNYLLVDRNIAFHPDDDFSEYIHFESRMPIFSKKESTQYNKIMKKCFKICKREKVDIYSIGLRLLKKLKLLP